MYLSSVNPLNFKCEGVWLPFKQYGAALEQFLTGQERGEVRARRSAAGERHYQATMQKNGRKVSVAIHPEI